jgi:hypothetical protein
MMAGVMAGVTAGLQNSWQSEVAGIGEVELWVA